MATPIAHKGVVAGAKVEAMTLLDLLLRPELVDQAWKYFKEEQSSKQKYVPMITETDQPPTYLNKNIMDQYRPQLKEFNYYETKYYT